LQENVSETYEDVENLDPFIFTFSATNITDEGDADIDIDGNIVVPQGGVIVTVTFGPGTGVIVVGDYRVIVEVNPI